MQTVCNVSSLTYQSFGSKTIGVQHYDI